MWTYYSAYMEPVGSFKKDLRPSNTHSYLRVGGARRDRTADLLNAIQALSQLSYGPIGRTLGESLPFVETVLNPKALQPQQK